MLFKLTNNKINRTTHCGVLEFVADEGKIYLPYWVSSKDALKLQHCSLDNKKSFPCFILIDTCFVFQMMRNMLLEEGALLEVESASLPIASFAKFQPQSCDFLDITNPKAVYP